MAFETYAYTREDAEIQRIRLESSTAAAGGFTAQTGYTIDGFVKVSKSNREFGLRPRGLRLSREDGNAKRYRFLPCATNTQQDSIKTAGTVTIGSVTWTVISPVGEDV